MQAASKTWTDVEVHRLIAQARTWVGVRWQHQGRSRSGVDCIGLFGAVGRELGVEVDLPSNYTHDPDPKTMLVGLRALFGEIPLKQATAGDFVTMRYNAKNIHLGLLTDKGVIHASAYFRAVVEHSLDEEWKRRIEYAFRLPRVTG